MVESGLSDHKLIHWTIPIPRPHRVYMRISRRRWKHFNHDQFISRLQTSALCLPTDPEKTVFELADCYQSVITNILDELAPVTEMLVRVRPHRPFYDSNCRQSRRAAQHLERAYRKKKGTGDEAQARESWRSSLKASRHLVKLKGRLEVAAMHITVFHICQSVTSMFIKLPPF